MAYTVQVAGKTIIKVGTGSGGALEELGLTRNGGYVTFNGHFVDVPGDENGGDDGPPVDVQFMGETAIIRLTLTKYDSVIAKKISTRVRGGVVGQPSAPGTLLLNANNSLRVLLASPVDPMNFVMCIPREPIELNKGTRFSELVFGVVAYKNGSGVLWNEVVD